MSEGAASLRLPFSRVQNYGQLPFYYTALLRVGILILKSDLSIYWNTHSNMQAGRHVRVRSIRTVSYINHSCPAWSNLQPSPYHLKQTAYESIGKDFSRLQLYLSTHLQSFLPLDFPLLVALFLTHTITLWVYQTRTGHTLSVPNEKIWTLPQAAGQTPHRGKTHTYTPLLRVLMLASQQMVFQAFSLLQRNFQCLNKISRDLPELWRASMMLTVWCKAAKYPHTAVPMISYIQLLIWKLIA